MRITDPYSRLKKRIESYVSRYPLPDKDENKERFRTLRKLKSDPKKQAEYKEIRDQIVISNGGFGMKYAIKYCRKISDNTIIEDMFQQAQIGILEAVDLFDPDYGVNFTTFAYHHVKKCLIEFIKENKLVKVPRSMARNIKNVKEVHNALFSENYGKNPTAVEIKVRLIKTKDIELKEEMIEDIVRLNDLNSGVNDETFIVGSVEDLPDEENTHEALVLLRSMIMNELSELDDGLIDIIRMRFGIECERPFSIPEIRLMRRLSDSKIEEFETVMNYRLNDDGTTKLCNTRNEELECYLESRNIARTVFSNGTMISTVFLAIGHNYTGEGPPILFETMLFSEEGLEEKCKRYATINDAYFGHGYMTGEYFTELTDKGMDIPSVRTHYLREPKTNDIIEVPVEKVTSKRLNLRQ
jgi:DNA-directed RNA polymerase sigma subunit (sigma70/sigma32)